MQRGRIHPCWVPLKEFYIFESNRIVSDNPITAGILKNILTKKEKIWISAKNA